MRNWQLRGSACSCRSNRNAKRWHTRYRWRIYCRPEGNRSGC
ncbi:MAG: hypothetical protein AB1458_09795 [Bacteroidota bacterium]